MKAWHHERVDHDETPTPVVVIGWVFLAMAILAAAGGLAFPASVRFVLFLQALLLLIVGTGLVSGRIWAYFAALAISVLNLITLVFAGVAGATSALAPLIVNAAIVFWLLRPNARRWSGLGRTS